MVSTQHKCSLCIFHLSLWKFKLSIKNLITLDQIYWFAIIYIFLQYLFWYDKIALVFFQVLFFFQVIPPISLSTTYKQLAPGAPKKHDYSRAGNPTRDVLEANIAALEDAEHCNLILKHWLSPDFCFDIV